MDEPLDSRYELVVIEGGGKGSRFYLNRTRMTLGRQDPGDEGQVGLVALPDRTVSRVHAVLEWDPRKHRYVLHHRSRTNYTVINGTQIEEPHPLASGDRIKLGTVVLELRQADPTDQPAQEEPTTFLGESDLYLFQVRGPEPGHLHPINYNQLLLSEPPQEPTSRPGVYVTGLGEVRATLHKDPDLWLESPRGERPVVLRSGGAIVEEWVVGTEGRFSIRQGDLLVAGQVAFVACDRVEAARLEERLSQSQQPDDLHPLLARLNPGQDPVYQTEQPHRFTVLSGAMRGTHFWVTPEALQKPLSFGKPGCDPAVDVELPDRKAARMELDFEPGRLLVRNTDPELRITQNWDEVTPGEETYGVSGDRFVLGRTVLRYEYLPIQAVVDRYSLQYSDLEVPLLRQESTIGYRTECDCRIDDRRLSPTHAVLKATLEGMVYRHQHKDTPARIGEQEVAAGQEIPLPVGQEVVLVPGISVRLVERTRQVNLSQATLIGPTQAEIEASRGGPA